jgi:hypothetical protein
MLTNIDIPDDDDELWNLLDNMNNEKPKTIDKTICINCNGSNLVNDQSK